MDHISSHVAAIAGGIEQAVAFLAGAVLECNNKRAFAINGNVQGYAVKGLVFIELNDSGGGIGADHTVFGEADAGGYEAELYVGVVTLRKKLLGRDMQGATGGEYGLFNKELFNAGMAVKAEAMEIWKMIPAGLYKELIKAVYKGAVVAHVQVGAEGTANELSFPAGNAEVTGSPAGGGCLSYCVRHATEEIFTISTVANDVIKPAGEFENAGLERHK
jgi:hypothetical protein